jgi:hypothetical protein
VKYAEDCPSWAKQKDRIRAEMLARDPLALDFSKTGRPPVKRLPRRDDLDAFLHQSEI